MVTTLVKTSMATSTKVSYHLAVKQYREFCASFGLIWYPVTHKTASKFLAFLHIMGFKVASIRSKLAALCYINSLHGFPSPTSHILIKKINKGLDNLSKTTQPPDKRLPISLHLLHLMIASLGPMYPYTFDRLLIKAILLLAFHAMLCIGE